MCRRNHDYEGLQDIVNTETRDVPDCQGAPPGGIARCASCS